MIPWNFWGQFKFVIDHAETVISTIVNIIFWYKHQLAYCVYPKYIIIKYQVIVMSKSTDSPVDVRINEDVAAISFLSLHGENNENKKNST